METARPDALFRDPFAERLAGPRGVEIVDAMKRGRAMAWAMIVRTAVFDEIILDRVRNGGVDLVVNLAAGLDARAWRLPLPPTLRWVDVDFPHMVEYKAQTIGDARPACRYEAIAADLTDAEARRALFQRLGAESTTTLIVSEGLLIYLTPEDVSDLARDLHAMPSARWWVIDLASPDLLKIMSRDWGKSVAAGNAPFRFAPAEGTRFFAPSGWRELEYRSALDEARRLHREMRLMWLWRFLGRLGSAARRERIRRFSGFVVLERT
jgi:methyltransferase (TIGR00027 family)